MNRPAQRFATGFLVFVLLAAGCGNSRSGPGENRWDGSAGQDSTSPGDGHAATDAGGPDAGQVSDAGNPDAFVPPSHFVRPDGMQFSQNGQPFRFIGVNMRGAAHYGHGDALPWSQAGDLALNFQEAANMRARVVRSFPAYNGISTQQAGDRLQNLLDQALSYGLTVIVVLTDFYAATPYHPQGDDGYYATDQNGFQVLTHQWFASGYQVNYKPFVQALVSRFSDHAAIFSWELGNELKDATFADSDPNTFIAFCHDMAEFIRGTDPNHMISVGAISVPNAGMSQSQGQVLYGHPDLAFLTVRSYSGVGDDDTPLAHSLNKPIIVEEAGFLAADGDRPALLQDDLTVWFSRSVAGYMQWAFMATPYDNGDGGAYGMDRALHNDWDGLFATYEPFAAAL